MATRRNGRDLQEDLALEQGLIRRLESRKSRPEDILFYFEMMRRIRLTARKMSRRDDELIEAVLRHGNLTEAARELSPEKAEGLRCYLSQRLRRFRELTLFVVPKSLQ